MQNYILTYSMAKWRIFWCFWIFQKRGALISASAVPKARLSSGISRKIIYRRWLRGWIQLHIHKNGTFIYTCQWTLFSEIDVAYAYTYIINTQTYTYAWLSYIGTCECMYINTQADLLVLAWQNIFSNFCLPISLPHLLIHLSMTPVLLTKLCLLLCQS